MTVASVFTQVDRICDYIPFISTASNIVDLFQKYVYKYLPENTANNSYWTHIKEKNISRCITLLVPILGNLYILVTDYFKYQAEIALQIEKKLKESQDLLWKGCSENNVESVRELLNKGISPNFHPTGTQIGWNGDENGPVKKGTPLEIACEKRHMDIIPLLLEHGSDPNTSIIKACRFGNLAVVKLLCPYIQDVNTEYDGNFTLLMYACERGHKDIVEFLIAKGADVRIKTSYGFDALMLAIMSHSVDLLPLLIQESENIDERRLNLRLIILIPLLSSAISLLYYMRLFQDHGNQRNIWLKDRMLNILILLQVMLFIMPHKG